MYNRESAPTEEQVRKYNLFLPMLNSAIHEMRDFAKKKQEGIVSETKVKIINRLLKEIREVLEMEESLKYLDLLEEEKFPQNSDAVLILGQYHAALKNFESRHHKTINYRATWVTKEWIDEKGEGEGEYEDYDEEDKE